MEDKEFENLRSQDINELITKLPTWIIRWGISVAFLLVIIILIISKIVVYPEVIISPLKLTTINAPKSIISKSNNKLKKLFVVDSAFVNEGEVLGILESTADISQVMKIDTIIDYVTNNIDSLKYENINALKLNEISKLGELQQEYQEFNLVLIELLSYLNNGFSFNKIKLIKSDLVYQENLNKALVRQREYLLRDLVLAEDEFNSKQILFNQGVIPNLEFKKAESSLISKKIPIQQIQSQILNNNSIINEKKKELLIIENNKSISYTNLKQSALVFKSKISEWKNQFMLISPINGKVAFIKLLQENQNLSQGEELLYIIPKTSEFIGEMYVDQNKFGKIKLDQQVKIKFDAYPYQEYGQIKARVYFISEVPQNEKYLITVKLENGLITEYNKTIRYRNEMKATAEIVTENLSVFDRIKYNFRKIDL